jgi:hypothetical protein
MATKKEPTIGQLIDQLWNLKQEKAELAKQDKVLAEQVTELEEKIYVLCDSQDTTRGAGSKASFSLGTTTTFNIDDFDALAKYVKRTGYFHLFQRRITVDAARELFESKGNVPGLSPFTKRKITVTTIK